MPPLEDQFPKVCGCGAVYSAEQWRQLRERGRYCDDVEALELRDCGECLSTIAVVVERYGEEERCA
jgi:hypothetical protein